MQGAQRVEPLSQFRIRYHRNGKDIYYNLKWKDAEQQGDIFLRRDDPICQDWLAEAVKAEVPPTSLRFHYSQHDKKIGFFDTHPGLTGILSMDKVTNKSINTEEHLLFTVITQDGVHLDEGIINQMMELPATWVNLAPVVPPQLSTLRQSSYHARLAQIEEENKQFFLAEAEKLDAFAEDLKQGLQRDLQELRKRITEQRKAMKANTANLTLAEMLGLKDEINRLEEKRKKMQRELYDEEDRIEAQNERLQEDLRKRLQGERTFENILTISFAID